MPMPQKMDFNTWQELAKKKAQGEDLPDASQTMPPGMALADNPSVATPDTSMRTPANNSAMASTVAAGSAKATTPVNMLQAAGSDNSALGGSTGEMRLTSGAVDVPAFVSAPKTEESRKNSGQDSSTTGITSQETGPIAEEAHNVAKRRAEAMPGIQALGSDLGNLRAMLKPQMDNANYADGSAKSDFSPLLAMADSLNGTNLLAGYKSPLANLTALGGLSRNLTEGDRALSMEEQAALGGQLKNILGGNQARTAGQTSEGVSSHGTTPEPTLGIIGNIQHRDDVFQKEAEGEIKEQKEEIPVSRALGNMNSIITANGGKVPGYVGTTRIPDAAISAAVTAAKLGMPFAAALGINISPQALYQLQDYRTNEAKLTAGIRHENFGARYAAPESSVVKQIVGQGLGAGPVANQQALKTLNDTMGSQVAARQGAMRGDARARLGAAALTPGVFANRSFGLQPPAAVAGGPGIQPGAAPPAATAAAPARGASSSGLIGSATAAPAVAPQAETPRAQRSPSTGLVRWVIKGPNGKDIEVPRPNGQ